MKIIGAWFLLGGIFAPPVLAHQGTLVYLRLEPEPSVLHARFSLSETDVGLTFGREGRVFRSDVSGAQNQLVKYITDRFQVSRDGDLCTPRFNDLDFETRTNGFFAVTKLDFVCPPSQSSYSINYQLLFEVDVRHQAFVTVAHGGQTQDLVLSSDRRSATLSGVSSPFATFWRYLGLGAEHIATGYDHLAFLLTLLLGVAWGAWRERSKAILALVSAFTIAHSITLIASALGWAQLAPALVEPAIAGSILYVAVENYFRDQPRHRFWAVFGFGLLHGFGFAGALIETGLPKQWLLLSLLSFNLGVELGQLGFVICILPLFWGLLSARKPLVRGAVALVGLLGLAALLTWAQVPPLKIAVFLLSGTALAVIATTYAGGAMGLRRIGSITIALFALLWLFERIAGRAWFGGLLG